MVFEMDKIKVLVDPDESWFKASIMFLGNNLDQVENFKTGPMSRVSYDLHRFRDCV